MKTFSPEDRRRCLTRAAETPFDVLIVGGGITGAGVAREAALRGLSVALVDKGDFASGTSSRSSKLIHGGVRYLQQGDVALVREAARERAVLRRIAPHLAAPVSMMIPAASVGSRLKLAAGLWTFDRLARDDEGGGHEIYDRARTLSAVPALRSDPVAGSVVFTEYVTNDARLTLETIRSAYESGAVAANYARVDRIEHRDDKVHVGITDVISGESMVATARCVVNAAGPWFDRIRGMNEANADSLVQLTRGIHIVVPRELLPTDYLVVLRAPDGRSAFVVPRGSYAYIGTTDTVYSGAPEEPGVTADDVRYLLESVAATFEVPPTAADVVGVWSGVRPLLKQPGKKPSEISRRDEIRVGPGPFVSIAGGKLTTYRRMAERVVERVLAVIGRAPERQVDSATVALIGGDSETQARLRAHRHRRSESQAVEERLWATYGVEAASILARSHDERGEMRCVAGLDDLTLAELEHFVEFEMASTLDDVLRRRTQLALLDTERSIATAGNVARALGGMLGWDATRVRQEVSEFERERGDELRAVRQVHGGAR